MTTNLPYLNGLEEEKKWITAKIDHLRREDEYQLSFYKPLKKDLIDFIESEGHVYTTVLNRIVFKKTADYSFKDLINCLESSCKIGVKEIRLHPRRITDEFLKNLKELKYNFYIMDNVYIRTKKDE